MSNEQPSTQTDHRYVKERTPFHQKVLGLSAQLFFKFPALFAITSEPVLDLMPVGIYITDELGKLYYANPPFANLLGYENKDEFNREVLENGGLQSVYSNPSEREKWIKQHESLQQPKNTVGKEAISEQQLKRRDGSIITVRDTSVLIGTDFHGCPVYLGTIQEITKEVEMRDQLEKDIITDPLTRLLNRRGLDRALQQEIERAKRGRRPLSILMTDIDFFKLINDKHGHPAGDAVLREVANALTNAVRGIDTVSRYGGEEYVIILPDDSSEKAFITAERIREIIKNLPLPLEENTDTRITISIGVAELRPEESEDELIKRTDIALYIAKKEGRDKTVIYTEEMVKPDTME